MKYSFAQRPATVKHQAINFQTGCSFLSLLSMSHYGHWCGVGNDGQEPLDNMDECCKQHDGCYDAVMTSGQCEVEQTGDNYIIVSQGPYSRCRTRCCPPTPGHGTVRTPWCATTAQSE